MFVGAPKVKGNILFEYQHTRRFRAWSPAFDWQFSGTRAGQRYQFVLCVAGYNLFDIGARYTSMMLGPRPSPGGSR